MPSAGNEDAAAASDAEYYARYFRMRNEILQNDARGDIQATPNVLRAKRSAPASPPSSMNAASSPGNDVLERGRVLDLVQRLEADARTNASVIQQLSEELSALKTECAFKDERIFELVARNPQTAAPEGAELAASIEGLMGRLSRVQEDLAAERLEKNRFKDLVHTQKLAMAKQQARLDESIIREGHQPDTEREMAELRLQLRESMNNEWSLRVQAEQDSKALALALAKLSELREPVDEPKALQKLQEKEAELAEMHTYMNKWRSEVIGIQAEQDTRNSELWNRCVVLVRELEASRGREAELESKLATDGSAADSFREASHHAEHELVEKRAEVLDLTRKMKANDELVSSLQMRLEAKKFEIQRFRDELEAMKLQVDGQTGHVADLERLLLDKTEATQVMEAELSSRLSEIDQKDAQLCELQQLCDLRDAEAREVSTVLEQELLTVRVQLEELAQTEQAKEDMLRSKNAMMVAQQADAAAQLEGLQRIIQENERLMQEKSAAVAQLQQEATLLKAENNELRQEKSAAVALLQQETKLMKAENNELRRSMHSMNQASTALQQELLAACSQLEEMARTVQGKEDLLKSKDVMMVAQQADAAAEIEALQCTIQENEGLLAEKGAAGNAPELLARVQQQDLMLHESSAEIEELRQRVEALKVGATRAVLAAVAEQKSESEAQSQIQMEAKNAEIRHLREQLASYSKVEGETDEIQQKLQLALLETQEKKAELQSKLANLQHGYGLQESELSLCNARILNLQAELQAAAQVAESASGQIAKFESQIRTLEEASTAETALWRNRALSAMEFLEAETSQQRSDRADGAKLLTSCAVLEIEAERSQLKSSVHELEKHAVLMTERVCAAEKLLTEERASRAHIEAERSEAIADAQKRLQLSELQRSQLKAENDSYKAALAKQWLHARVPGGDGAVVEADPPQLKQALESSKLAIEFYDAKVSQCERQLESLAAFHSETEQAAVCEIRSLRSVVSTQRASILDLTSQVSSQALQASLNKTIFSVSSHPKAFDDELSQLEQVFDAIDANHDGHLSRAELIHAVRESQAIADLLGLPRHIRQEDGTRDLFEAIFQKLDANDDKTVSRGEFIHFFQKHRKNQSHPNVPTDAKPSPSNTPTVAQKTAPRNTAVDATDSFAEKHAALQQAVAAATLKAALVSQWCLQRELENARQEIATKNGSMRDMQAQLDELGLAIELNEGPLEAERDERVENLWNRVVQLQAELESSHLQLAARSKEDAAIPDATDLPAGTAMNTPIEPAEEEIARFQVCQVCRGALDTLTRNAPWSALRQDPPAVPQEPRVSFESIASIETEGSAADQRQVPLTGVDAADALQALADQWWKQHRTFANLMASLDADHDNTISPQELERALAQLGLSIRPEQLRLVVMTFDRNRDGRISRSEVVREILARKPQGTPERDDSGAPKAGVQASLTVDTDYNTLTSDSSKLARFKAEVVTEMAQELKKSPSEIRITSLRAGSVIVGVFIEEGDPERAASLETQIRSGPLSKQVGGYPVKAVQVSTVASANGLGHPSALASRGQDAAAGPAPDSSALPVQSGSSSAAVTLPPFSVGDFVTVSPEYREIGDAFQGPLAPGYVGVIVHDDGSDKPFQVQYGERKWWYVAEALHKADGPIVGSATAGEEVEKKLAAAALHVEAQNIESPPPQPCLRAAVPSPQPAQLYAEEMVLAAPQLNSAAPSPPAAGFPWTPTQVPKSLKSPTASPCSGGGLPRTQAVVYLGSPGEGR